MSECVTFCSKQEEAHCQRVSELTVQFLQRRSDDTSGAVSHRVGHFIADGLSQEEGIKNDTPPISLFHPFFFFFFKTTSQVSWLPARSLPLDPKELLLIKSTEPSQLPSGQGPGALREQRALFSRNKGGRGLFPVGA